MTNGQGPMTKEIPYDRFFSLCEKAFARVGSIFDLPVAAGPYEYLRETFARDYPRGRVLDFGCGVKKPLQRVLALGDDRYHSCDSDPLGKFTYGSPEAIPPAGTSGRLAAANQVIEHLGFGEALRVTSQLARHVAPGRHLRDRGPQSGPIPRGSSAIRRTRPPGTSSTSAQLGAGRPGTGVLCLRDKVPGPRWWERPLVNLMCRVFRMDGCDSVFAIGRRRT